MNAYDLVSAYGAMSASFSVSLFPVHFALLNLIVRIGEGVRPCRIYAHGQIQLEDAHGCEGFLSIRFLCLEEDGFEEVPL